MAVADRPHLRPTGPPLHLRLGFQLTEADGPAVAATDLGPIDAVLLNHDHHGDNLDDAGRALLPSAGAVLTTVSGARRLGGNARGLQPWATTRLEAPGRRSMEVTATPAATAHP
jgi:hypothetical protein